MMCMGASAVLIYVSTVRLVIQDEDLSSKLSEKLFSCIGCTAVCAVNSYF